MLDHGGGLRLAAQLHGIALGEWLDLSTGINPNGWIPPQPPDALWQRLPEEGDGLEQAACEYYGCQQLLPVAGTQPAIQALPALRPLSSVGVLSPGYSEHAHAWECHRHQVRKIAAGDIDRHIEGFDVLVICNPNNPDGRTFSKLQLLDWHAQLAARGGWLVVDEAFMDATPNESLATIGPRSGLIILRSLGKFFGLAGARVGFVLSERKLLEQMREKLGPWSISGPSRWIASKALVDQGWQMQMRRELPLASARLQSLLIRAGLEPSGGTALYQYVRCGGVDKVAETLAKAGILVRLFPEQSALRFGLPGKEHAWQRLEDGLPPGHATVQVV